MRRPSVIRLTTSNIQTRRTTRSVWESLCHLQFFSLWVNEGKKTNSIQGCLQLFWVRVSVCVCVCLLFIFFLTFFPLPWCPGALKRITTEPQSTEKTGFFFKSQLILQLPLQGQQGEVGRDQNCFYRSSPPNHCS